MSKLLIPPEAKKELLPLINADISRLEKLTELFNSPNATNTRTNKFLNKVADVFDIPLDKAFEFVMLVEFLSQQKEISNTTDEDFISELKNLDKKRLDRLSDPSHQTVVTALFGPKPIAELAKKKEKLKTGLLKTLSKIEGTCELRPVFNLERSHIVDTVVTVTARMSFSDDQEEKDSLTIQLNDKSLKKLKEFLEITEKKMQIMKEEITEVQPQ